MANQPVTEEMVEAAQLAFADAERANISDSLTRRMLEAAQAVAPPKQQECIFTDPARVLAAVRAVGASSPWHKDGVLCVPKAQADELFNAAYNYREPAADILARAVEETRPLIERERAGAQADGETMNMRFGSSPAAPATPSLQPTTDELGWRASTAVQQARDVLSEKASARSNANIPVSWRIREKEYEAAVDNLCDAVEIFGPPFKAGAAPATEEPSSGKSGEALR